MSEHEKRREVAAALATRCWRPAPAVQGRAIGDEFLLVPVGAGVPLREAYSLNEVGAYCWRLLAAEPRTVAQLAAAVAGTYEVSVQTALADCQHFLAALRDQGLVEVAV